MRNVAFCVLFGTAIAVISCGGSSNGGGTGGAAGATGKGGSAGGSAGAIGNGGSGGGVAGSGGSAAGAGGGGAGAGGHGGGSAGTAGGGATGTGGATACGDATGTGSGATCNVIAADGPCVTSTFSTAATPTAAGGLFADGTYNLVSQTTYGPADAGFSAQVFRQTYVLSGVTTTSFTLDQVETSGTAVARAHGTVAVSGMTATFTPTCPATDGGSDSGGSADFTATSSSITLFQLKNGLVQVSVYNKAS